MRSFFALPLGLLSFLSGLVIATPCKLFPVSEDSLYSAVLKRGFELFLWYLKSFPVN